MLMQEYLWRIRIDGDSMSISMFNDFCENILKVVKYRVISLRISFNNTIGGWSLVSSALKHYRTMLLQRLHLIDIQPYEFDKLLCNHSIKQLHTLIVDITESNPFNHQFVEGAYLAKERNNWNIGLDYHCFALFTTPYHGTKLQTEFFSEDLQVSSPTQLNPIDLFPKANELFIEGFNGESSHHRLCNPSRSISSLVPWSLLTTIFIDGSDFISAFELEAILRMTYNVDKLRISEDNDILCSAILRDTDNLATRVNQQ
ncbi:unnamed protein product, partial [Rotaria magnacalcarata]